MRKYLQLGTVLVVSIIMPNILGPAGVETVLFGQSQTPARDASQFSGADAAAKINACIGALPARGGVCDARGLAGDQTLGSDIFAGVKKPGVLLLGPATFTLNATQNVPPGWFIDGSPGGYDADASSKNHGTLFRLGNATVAFKFKGVYRVRFENIGIDCNSIPGSVGIWYTSDNAPASSQNEFSHFGVYNFQYGFQIGPPVTSANTQDQMDQITIRRFQMISQVPGAEAFTFNAANAVQASIIEEGSIQLVNIGFDWKWYGGLAQVKRVVFGSMKNGGALNITGATSTTPIVIATSSEHGYASGNRVQIAGASGNTAANGIWYVTVVDSTHFSLDGSSGNGRYASGGTATRMATSFNLSSPSDYWIEECQAEKGPREPFQPIAGATNSTPIVLTVPNHGYQTGDIIKVLGVQGNPAADSDWQITRIDSSRFSLNGSVGKGMPLLTPCSKRDAFGYAGGSCVQRLDVNFININGSPYNGAAITLLGNKFDDPVVVHRGARITSISNYGGSVAMVTAGAPARIVSINDRFPRSMGGWDTSAGGQVLRVGGGDTGSDSVALTAPSLPAASLGSPPDGTIVFCTDCNSTCTAAGGAGQVCFRVNGAWTH